MKATFKAKYYFRIKNIIFLLWLHKFKANWSYSFYNEIKFYIFESFKNSIVFYITSATTLGIIKKVAITSESV